MARHSRTSTSSTGLRRAAQLCGLVGGLAWVAAAVLDGTLGDVLLWGGAALLTVALFGLGLLLVKSDVLLLRVFVGLALPALVWGVVVLLRDAFDTSLVDAVFGGCVAAISAITLARRSGRRRATL